MTVRTFVIRSSDIARCPKLSMLPAHYTDDGRCLCDERVSAQRALDEAQRQLVEAQERVREAEERVRAARQSLKEH